jgi:4a-hydroxytetrahydrobiopterin dehydratase
MSLADRRCAACHRGTPRLSPAQSEELRRQLSGWELRGERLHRRFRFGDFPASIRFVDEMARIAEEEGHHPVFTVNIGQVDVDLWTHAIDGLSENDFILAAKLDRAAQS